MHLTKENIGVSFLNQIADEPPIVAASSDAERSASVTLYSLPIMPHIVAQRRCVCEQRWCIVVTFRPYIREQFIRIALKTWSVAQ